MDVTWLKCLLLRGMFSDELAVRYGDLSFFAPRESVQGEADREGKVKVRVFRRDNQSWAVLPTENQLVIPVAESDLVPA